MIEQKATDQDGRIVFTADLPINGSYYVKEVQCRLLLDFVTTEEIKNLIFTYAGEEVAEVSFEFTYEDEPTTFEITKSDITTGEELPDCKTESIRFRETLWMSGHPEAHHTSLRNWKLERNIH